MTCKHENADHLKPGEILTPSDYAPIEEGHPVLVEQFRCIDCGAWLSLGPSTPPPRIELQLAEWLADVHRLWAPSRERTKIINNGVAAYARKP